MDRSASESAATGPFDTGGTSPTGSPPAALTVGAVARRLGVAPATLRTWARRYGLGPTEHVAGAHRRYGAQDVARLDLMRRMVEAGVGPRDAARAARAATAQLLAPADLTVPPAPPVPAPTHGCSERELAGAARALDGPGCRRLVTDCLTSWGAARTWDEVLEPALGSLRVSHPSSAADGEPEHLLSTVATTALSSLVLDATGHRNPRPVLLAGADEEHPLALWAVAAALSENRVSARVLGCRVPAPALVAAVRRVGPAAVLVWSSAPGELPGLADLPAVRPTPLLVLGGPGWSIAPPPGARRSTSLGDAVDLICAAAL